ncbi:hypothetical protein ACWDWV_12105, partial [Streptosporangium sandarakinum]
MVRLPFDDENAPLYSVGQVADMLQVERAFLRRRHPRSRSTRIARRSGEWRSGTSARSTSWRDGSSC